MGGADRWSQPMGPSALHKKQVMMSVQTDIAEAGEHAVQTLPEVPPEPGTQAGLHFSLYLLQGRAAGGRPREAWRLPFPPLLGHYESNFAGLNVHEPPPHPRQHVWMPGTGALSDFSRGPSRQHSLHHHLARLSRDDEAMMCPSAQIQVTLPARTPG